jgi:hypothetical protein
MTLRSSLPRSLIALSLTLATGCASLNQSMLLGASVGAMSMGAAGNLATNHRPEGTALGALTGAALGAAIGYFAHHDLATKERLARDMEKSHEAPAEPKLTRPKYRQIWVPAKIEGDRYIEGHRLYIIEDPGKWTE